ncbi:MAG: fumarylacetoacetate hydrolase family protein [Ardenticatenaceae bacterium]|nr:fumarylacetoacetate hydrolase family protein [Anaerolineales bacterium]MCB8922093.1 fumarylacetoacetate hydrolase family protein [Ardenticatenaceae bacterium]MCB9003209.1 fumarylacetoacetate hydrolase family protein [Ardenticatenaceae bacterium]
MKLVTYELNGAVKLGAVWGDGVVDLTAVASDMLTLIAQGAAGLAAVEVVLATETAVSTPLSELRLLAPIPNPRRNVMCLGLNYAEHAIESYAAKGRQASLPTTPIIFTKATTAVSGPYDPIPFDTAVSSEIDWEVELAIIIGKQGKNIPAEEALEYVFGYTVLNDISARDLQMNGKQYFKGKSLDGACPTGPWIVTPDELDAPQNLRITSRVNGETKQDGNTRFMIFDIPAIIAYLSKGMTLLPGDIIATGTPEGVGFARTPPEFLRPGDVLESEVAGIGVLRNVVTAVSTPTSFVEKNTKTS